MADPRPQYQFGTGTIGDQSFHWGSGEPGKYWSIPYGDYPVTPDAPTGAWAHQVGAIPIANNVIPDPQLGRNRIGIMIHSGSASSLDALYTQGCFKVAPSEWPAVRQEILKEAGNAPLYLHVQPGGIASFTNTKTLDQASIPTAGAPGPPVGVLAANQGPETVGSNQAYKFTLPQNAPMGMGNNNPLNIKYYKGAEKDYPGLVGPSSNTDQGDPQMKFGSPEAGWNAAYNLLNKKYTGGMTTPNQIIAGKGGWTPGNAQAAANIAKVAGIGPDDDINFSDPAKAQAFMRALVTQEQGAAGKAYPDAMIAASIGGHAPADVGGNAPTAVAAAPAPADQGTWWQKAYGKIVDKPVDAQGNPTGKPSPMENIASAFEKGPERMKALEEDQAPESVKNYTGTAPPARNVSPGLANVSQTYGQTLNSFSQPLTWNDAPPQAPQMPAGGFRPAPASQRPGISLNSVQPSPYGVGYGINPVGYGYG